MRTTFPRRPAASRGGEWSHSVAPANEGKRPSVGSLEEVRAIAPSLSVGVGRDDRVDECGGRFLRKVVSDPTRDRAMLVWARELGRVGGRLRMRRPVGVPFE